MSWQDDYYLGSSDYPITGEDEAVLDTYFGAGDDLAAVLTSDEPALD